MKQISRRAISLWRLKSLIVFVIIMIAALVTFIMYNVTDFMPLFVSIIIAAVALYVLIIDVIIIPNIRYRTTRYGIIGDVLKVHQGVFTKTRHHVPLIRIQNIDTKRGPLMAYFKLKGVQLRTASSVVYIPELNEDEADHVRSEIRQIVNENVGRSI